LSGIFASSWLGDLLTRLDGIVRNFVFFNPLRLVAVLGLKAAFRTSPSQMSAEGR
jgi:hypothetical protein